MGAILVTGGWGFLGLNVAWSLASRGMRVLLLSRRSVKVPSFLASFWDAEIRGVTGDISDLSSLLGLMEKHEVESIVHAAHYQFDVSGGKIPLYEALKGNLIGTANLLEAARTVPLKRVSFISSETVYFGVKNAATLHEDLDLPLAGEADMDIAGIKRLGEQICLIYAQRYGLSIPILRLDRLYGPMSHGRRFPIGTMVECAVANRPCDVSHVYGGERANYTYIKDAAKGVALVHLASQLEHSIYNVAAGVMYSYLDFAEGLREVVSGAAITLGSTMSPTQREYPPLSVARIQKELGFRPDYDLKQALKDYTAWLREGIY